MKLLTYDEFMTDYKAQYDAVFSGNYVDEGCFRDPAWKQVLLPTHRIRDIDQSVFSAMERAVYEAGDKENVVMTEIEGPHGESACLYFDKDELDTAWVNYMFSPLDSVVFGKSAMWGMFIAYDDFICIGGMDVFMDQFLDGVEGGVERLKRDFFANAEWMVDSLVEEKILQRIGWH